MTERQFKQIQASCFASRPAGDKTKRIVNVSMVQLQC